MSIERQCILIKGSMDSCLIICANTQLDKHELRNGQMWPLANFLWPLIDCSVHFKFSVPASPVITSML